MCLFILFLEPPSPKELAYFREAHAVNLAGVSSTMTQDEIDVALPEAFASLKDLGAPITCSKQAA